MICLPPLWRAICYVVFIFCFRKKLLKLFIITKFLMNHMKYFKWVNLVAEALTFLSSAFPQKLLNFTHQANTRCYKVTRWRLKDVTISLFILQAQLLSFSTLFEKALKCHKYFFHAKSFFSSLAMTILIFAVHNKCWTTNFTYFLSLASSKYITYMTKCCCWMFGRMERLNDSRKNYFLYGLWRTLQTAWCCWLSV